MKHIVLFFLNDFFDDKYHIKKLDHALCFRLVEVHAKITINFEADICGAESLIAREIQRQYKQLFATAKIWVCTI